MIAGFLHYPLIIVEDIDDELEPFKHRNFSDINENTMSDIVLRKHLYMECYIEKERKRKFHLELLVHKEGLFLFLFKNDFDEEMDSHNRLSLRNDVIAKMMNSLILFLHYSGKQIINYHDITSVDPHDMITMAATAKGETRFFLGALNRMYSPHQIYEFSDLSKPLTAMFKVDRAVFRLQHLNAAVNNWANAVAIEPITIDLMSQITRSLVDAIRHDNLSAIVISWTIIEIIIN